MIYFMRHGQDDDNYVGGWSNVSLIQRGRDEVLQRAKWIKNNLSIKRIICSDVNRAIETAKIVSDELGIPYSVNSNFREQNKGLLNGILKEDASREYTWFRNNEVTVDTVYPEGESLRDLYNRIKDNLDDILKIDDDTLVITHRGVINMIYYLLSNKEIDMNKKQFGVSTASIHELDKINKIIRKVR